MKVFADNFKSTKIEPQVFSLFLVVVILSVLAVVIYKKTKLQKVDQAPGGLLLITEIYVSNIESLYKGTTNNKIQKPAPYIFALMTLLLTSNLISLLGFEAPTTSYSFTFTLSMVAWIGIYVVGIMHHRFRFFKKYLNPAELIGQFSPLISLSFRIFGNIIGGSVIMYLIYAFTGWLWGFIPIIGEFNLLGSVIAPVFHLYFDIFDGIIQAFVFTLLTMVYWALETEVEEKPKKVKKVKNKKALNIKKI